MHKLGQCFLKDKSALKKIVGAAEISSTDTIVEIGPGHGELTCFVLEKTPKRLIVIEKDTRLAKELESLNPRLEIITGDAREELEKISANIKSAWKLIGNIPYYATGAIFRAVSEIEDKPSVVVFTVQKEVAERIVAVAPQFNKLAASISLWADAKMVGQIRAESFSPRPKVDSAIVLLTTRPGLHLVDDRVISAIFKQPRKTLLNNIFESTGTHKEAVSAFLRSLCIDPLSRPGKLSRLEVEKLTANWDRLE